MFDIYSLFSHFCFYGLYRKPLRVKATTLQEEDEKVVVEDSFPAKTSSIDQEEAIDSGVSTSTPSRVDSWIIKFEQMLNIALTVCS